MPLRGGRGGRESSPAASVSSGGSWSSGCSLGVAVAGASATGVDLVVAGRRYTRARANADGSVRWTCATRGCPASLRTDAKGVVLLRRGARHRCALPPPPDRQAANAATAQRLGALSADEAGASDSDRDAPDNLPLARRLHPAPTGPSGWPLLHPVNPYLTCGLCSGYLIDATTIVDCMHSFCRSCIILHLRSNSFCPTCEQILRRFDPPLHGLRRDHTLQTLVYKMVPGLYRKERERRKAFGQQDPQQHRLPKPAKNILTDEEKINIALQYDECMENDGGDGNLYRRDKEMKRYLKCPAAVRIRYLQHFIRMKYGLSEAHRVDIIYNDECLPQNFTLKDVLYIFSLDKYKEVEFGFRIYLQDPAEQSKIAHNASSVQNNSRRPHKRKQTVKKKQPVAPTRSKLSRSQSTPNVSVCIESPEPSAIVPSISEEYDVTTKNKRGRGRGRGRGRRARSGTRKDKNSFASLDDDLLRAGHLFEMEFDPIASTSHYQGNSATDYEDFNQVNDEKSASPKRVTHQTGSSTKDNNSVNMPFVSVTFSHDEAPTVEAGQFNATRDNVFCVEDNPRTPNESSKFKLSETQEDSVGEVISDSGKERIPVSESVMFSPKHDCFYSSCSSNNESAPSQQICMPGKLVSARLQSRTMLSPPRISPPKCSNSDVFDSRHNSQCTVQEQFCDPSNVNNVPNVEGSLLSVCGSRSPSGVIGVTEQKCGKSASVDLTMDVNAQIPNCQQNISVLNNEKPDKMDREEKCVDGAEYVPPSKRLCVEQEQSLAPSENIGEGKVVLEGAEGTVCNKVDPKICTNETQNAKFLKAADAVNACVKNEEAERSEINNGFRRMTHKINNNMELISKRLEQNFSESSKQKMNARFRNKVTNQKRMKLKGTALFKTLEPLSSSLHRKCLVSKVYGLVGSRNMNWRKGRCKTKDTAHKCRKRRIMHSVLIKKFDIDCEAAAPSSGQVSNVSAPQTLEERKTEVHNSSPLHRESCKTCQNNQSSAVIWKKVLTPSRKRRYSESFEKTDKEQVIGGKVNGLTVTGITELSGETDTGFVKTTSNVDEDEIANKTNNSIICTDSSQSGVVSSLQNNGGTASTIINNTKEANFHSLLSVDTVDSTNISNTYSISGKKLQNEIKPVNMQNSQVDHAHPIRNPSKVATDNTAKNEIIQCKESSKKETGMSSKESTSSNKSSKAGDKDSNYSDKSSNYSEFDDFSEEDELILRVSEHEDDEVVSRVSDHEDDEIMNENGEQSQEVQKSAKEDKVVTDEPKNNSNKISEISNSSETKAKEGRRKTSQVPSPASQETKDAERISKEKGVETKSAQKIWSETNRPDKVTSHNILSACHSVNRTGSSISPVSSSNSSQQCTPKGNNSNSVIPQTAANKTDKKPKGGNLYELTLKPKENALVPPPSITISRLNSNLKPKQRTETSNSSKNKRPSLEILPVKPSGTPQSATTDRNKRISLGSPYFTPKRKPANMPLLKPPQLLQNAASQPQNYPTETVTKNGLQIIPTSTKNEVVSSSSRKPPVTTTSVSNNANSKSSENSANKTTRGGEAVLDLSEKSTRYKGSSPELLHQSPNEIQPPKSFVTANQIAQNRASLCSTLSNFQHFQHHYSAKTPPQNLPQAGIASALGTALSSALRGTLNSSQAARGIPNDVMHPAATNSSFLVNRNTLSGASMQYCNAKDETEKSVKQQIYQNIQQKSKGAHTVTAASSQNVNNAASQMMYGRNVRMQPGVHMGHVHTSSVYPETSPSGPKEYPDPRSPIPLSPTTPVSSPLSPTHQAMANFGCLSPTYNPHPLYKSFTSASSEIAYDRAKRNLMPEHRNPGPSQTVRHIPNPSTLQFRQQRRNCSPSNAPQNVSSNSPNNSLSSKMPFLHQRLLEASNSASKSVPATSTSSTLTLNSGNFVSHDKSKPLRRNSANK